MYNKIYQSLNEKGKVKTGIFLDGPYMGKKCILDPGTQLLPENPDDGSIWSNYLNILDETR